MIATLREPFETVKGILAREGQVYVRMVHGKAIIQRKPNRKGHIASEAEKRNQEWFKNHCPGNKWRKLSHNKDTMQTSISMVTECSPNGERESTVNNKGVF